MSSQGRDLCLHQQVLLLALRDDKGTLESRAGHYRFAMAGALLAELALEDRITIGEGKRFLVDPSSSTPLGDELLDEALALVTTAKRRRRAANWVSRFGRLEKLRERTALELCRRGVLQDREEQILLIFKRKVYPTLDPGPEQALIARLRDAVYGESCTLDPRLAVLVGLADATGLLRVTFERRELRARKARLAQIASGEVVAASASQAAAQAVQAARAAMLAAIAASSAATSAAT